MRPLLLTLVLASGVSVAWARAATSSTAEHDDGAPAPREGPPDHPQALRRAARTGEVRARFEVARDAVGATSRPRVRSCRGSTSGSAIAALLRSRSRRRGR